MLKAIDTPRGRFWMQVVLGGTLVAAGTALLVERLRADGFHSLWPLILVVVGAGRVATGPSDARDQGWWLIGTGSWLLLSSVGPMLAHEVISFAVVFAGVTTCRQAFARQAGPVSLEDSHVV